MRSELRPFRLAADLTQERLAELAGISRQAYGAIETGRSVPSTEVALRLARALGRSVEELFRLEETGSDLVVVDAAVGGPAGGRVRLARVGGQEAAYRLDAAWALSAVRADGIAEPVADGRVRVQPLPGAVRPPDLVVAGCDPAFGIVVDQLRRHHDVEVLWLRAGSRAALEALARGAVHVAGVHLGDPDSGAYNEPWIRRLVPGPVSRIRFATWEQVLLAAPGNPLGLAGPGDLARPGLRFVNREPGSGSRALVERVLAERDIAPDRVGGFHQTAAPGHLAVADAVAAGLADAGVAIRAAARAHDLVAFPLVEEPYDLVVPDAYLDLPAVGALLSVLRRPALARHVEALGGYDTTGMGRPA